MQAAGLTWQLAWKTDRRQLPAAGLTPLSLSAPWDMPAPCHLPACLCRALTSFPMPCHPLPATTLLIWRRSGADSGGQGGLLSLPSSLPASLSLSLMTVLKLEVGWRAEWMRWNMPDTTHGRTGNRHDRLTEAVRQASRIQAYSLQHVPAGFPLPPSPPHTTTYPTPSPPLPPPQEICLHPHIYLSIMHTCMATFVCCSCMHAAASCLHCTFSFLHSISLSCYLHMSDVTSSHLDCRHGHGHFGGREEVESWPPFLHWNLILPPSGLGKEASALPPCLPAACLYLPCPFLPTYKFSGDSFMFAPAMGGLHSGWVQVGGQVGLGGSDRSRLGGGFSSSISGNFRQAGLDGLGLTPDHA